MLVRLVDHSNGWNGNYVFVSESAFRFLRKSEVAPGDVIVANVGANAGTVFRAPRLPYPMTLGPNAVLCRPDRQILLRDFLYYFLSSPPGQDLLRSIVSGSAQPKFNKTDLRNAAVPAPSLPQQRAIAAVLGALDDKIDLNRRMSETLEETARALFKSWFVDFDPVRAKAEGRQPFGMDAATAALFPASFDDSETGEVPKGWAVDALDGIASFLNGLALQKFPPIEGRPVLPVIKIAQLRAGAPNERELADAAVPAQYVIEDGDLLFSWSGSLLVDVWCGGRGALNQHLFKVTSDRCPKWFFKGWLDHHLPSFQAIAADKATTMGHIQRRHLTEAKVAIPPQAVITAAGGTFEPMLARAVSSRVESRTLAELRDYLLPKLLSGEVRMRDAEKLVGEAT
ncbi:Type I restriction-modification system, specificity subunit S [Sandaracinus amylolyticus]|uniref:Type I restriction-modification system, specificity subunit S n=1 Tax=Sandaracinus amylolyticus TaxID=927083 RepID=A0A0F6W8D5_9BACT|nr:Type I restriction-modification system, specificity subunit S [Sandaracinus amylolyticus]